ncbi:hypothetical protein MRX96_019012 [Rhipicephalus microplus]
MRWSVEDNSIPGNVRNRHLDTDELFNAVSLEENDFFAAMQQWSGSQPCTRSASNSFRQLSSVTLAFVPRRARKQVRHVKICGDDPLPDCRMQPGQISEWYAWYALLVAWKEAGAVCAVVAHALWQRPR